MSAKRIIFRPGCILLASVLLLTVLPLQAAHAADVFYVKPGGTGDCYNWDQACSLDIALTYATLPGDEIWAAAGTYKPTTDPTDRSATFQLVGSVSVYGGFTGTENARSQRDPASNLTILSGDIDNDDSQKPVITDLTTVTGNSTNSYHVVSGATGATLDGFTITAGNANGTTLSYNNGGGMYNYSSSPTLTDLIFSGNSAGNGNGGGIYNDTNSSPILTNITFNGNSAAGSGGGMLNNASSNPTLTNVTFSGNTAVSYYGGGMFNYSSSPTLTNITFSSNSAPYGGGMCNQSASSPTLTNVTFSGNSADHGGGIANIYSSNPAIRNTIFWGNTAVTDGAQIFNYASGSYPSVPVVSDSVVQDGYADGTNIFASDPMLGTLGDYGGLTETFPLLPGSSAVDSGNDDVAVCPATDQRGISRPQRTHCDIGAYEYDYAGIYYIKPAASGAANCQDWADTCLLHNALITATSGDEIWVEAGTYKPTSDPADRSATFQLAVGVPVYGGFTGTETERAQRNPASNLTVLSGDIDGDDSQTPVITDLTTVTGNTTNSYHVVTGITGATLDGFTITAGNANDIADPNDNGGGMYNSASSPTLTNLIFSGNSADNAGGGMYNETGSLPALTNVTFSNNAATISGGGMYNSSSSPSLANVTLSNNTALNGGGIYNTSSNPTLTNVTFSNNSADGPGGGMYNNLSSPTFTNATFSGNTAYSGGGMDNDNGSNPTLTSATFSANSAGAYGGGMFNKSSNPTLSDITFNGNTAVSYGGGMYNNSGNPTLTNVTFSSNSSSLQGGGMYNFSSSPILTNVTFNSNSADYGGGMGNKTGTSSSSPPINDTIFWGNTGTSGGNEIYNGDSSSIPVVSDSVVQGGYAGGTNIISTDPLLGTLGNYGGYTQTIPLLPGSSAIDAGNTSTCATTDQRSVKRPQGLQCDIGAYEFLSGIYYVKPVTSGNDTCQSWEDACILQKALTNVISGDEIWAAAGTYKPTTNLTDRSATFQLIDGVAVYGGFAGTEIARIQRDPAANPTILSGDLKGDDVGFSNNSENVYHVVTGATGATLDGFTVTGGNADGSYPNDSGGGMYNDVSNPTLANVTFARNAAINYGGGMYNHSTSSTLTNIGFSNNSANFGGGMYNSSSLPTLTNVAFSSNLATGSGGGMYNWSASSLVLTNATFNGNSASYGGGIYNGSSSNPTLTNVTFSGNSASNSGGGMQNYSSSPTIRNTIFWGNTAVTNGAQIFNEDSSSIPVVSDSVLQAGYTGGANIITTDPLLGTFGDHGGPTQTIPLQPGSSAIDSGNDFICPATDQRGVARPQGPHCDIGAYEYKDITAPTITTFTVSSPSNSHDIPISAFAATDDVGVTGYLITTSATAPTAGAAGWTVGAPTIYTVTSDGSYTLHPWAKDSAGNVSTVFASPRLVEVDTIKPAVSAFTATTPSNSLAIPISAFTAIDAGGVTGYMISESTTPPAVDDAGWTTSPPATYTVAADGSYTLYPWAKDAAGNISTAFSFPRTVVVDTISPVVATFTVTTPTNNLAIPIPAFSATDGEGVTGYLITITATSPTADDTRWISNRPTTYTVASEGAYTLYPWARDAAGNVSTLFASPGAVVVDTTAPVVSVFTASTPSSSLTIPIPAFSATDAGGAGVSGYLITKTVTPPAVNDTGWAGMAPTTYTVASDGSYTLHPWAKDAAGNISALFATPAAVVVDTTLPVVNTFTATSPSNNLTIPIPAFSATDGEGVTGYLISTTAAPPATGDPNWTGTAPTTYTVASDGAYSLYPWVKDAAGNVSVVFATPRAVVVDTTAPVVSTFTATSPTNNLAIPIPVFSATDTGGVGVSGYLITTTASPPAAGDPNWTGTSPTTYTAPAEGSYTLYPWAKDAAGNVSALFGTPGAVLVDTTLPVVSAFTATSLSNSLAIPIPAFSATDTGGVGVSGYLITTTAAPPAAGDSNWAGTPPTTYTVTSDGSYTLYPWAKDAAGNVSAGFATPPTVVVDTTAPVVSAFTATSPTNNLAIPIPVFSATDAVGVSGYLISTTATPPAAGDPNWAVTAPTTFTVASDGSYTLYPWAKDAAGNVSAVLATPLTVVVDTFAPTVVSSVLFNQNPTGLDSVDFTVTFSEPVIGVETGDFSLGTIGIFGATVTGVSSSGSVYTVTVNTGSGNGTIRLELPAGVTITDLAGNPLSGLPYTGGETYTVNKIHTLFLPLIMR